MLKCYANTGYIIAGTLVGHLCRNCLRSLCRKVPFGRGPLDPGSGGGGGGEEATLWSDHAAACLPLVDRNRDIHACFPSPSQRQ
jgi:hypothetical protein